MLLAYVIYSFLPIFMSSNAVLYLSLKNKGFRISYWNIISFISIGVFSIVLGLRYNVGTDYLSYYFTYINQFKYTFDIRWEPAFVFLYKTLSFFELPPECLFITIAFIQILLIYKAFEDKPKLLPFALVVLFVSGQIFGMLNILRHSIAILFLLCSIKYTYARSLCKFLFYLLLACLFHISSLAFIPVLLLFFLKTDIFFDRIWVQLIIFAACVIFRDVIYNNILQAFLFIMLMNSASAEELTAFGGIETEMGSGVGRILNWSIFICLAVVSPVLSKRFGISYLQYYRVYYAGQLFLVIAGVDMNLRRIAGCYTIASLVIFSFLFYYLYFHWKSLPKYVQIIGVYIATLLCLLFMQKIYVGESLCSPFQFTI